MHLEIKQSTSGTETVSAQLINKLYELAYEDQTLGITSQLDATSDVQGRLEAPAAYEDAVRYLVGIDAGDPKRFQNLYITVPNNNYYIRFKDPIVSSICIQAYGDGVGITRTAATSVITDFWGMMNSSYMTNEVKSQVTNLDDFQYFTGLTLDENIIYNFPNATSIKFPSVTFNKKGNYTRYVVQYSRNLQTIDYSNAVFVNTTNATYSIIYGNDVIQDWDPSLLPNQLSFHRIQLFNTWTKLQKIIFSEGITATDENFRGMSALQYAEFPSTITEMGYANNLGRDGRNIPCVVVKAVTPPTWNGYNPNDTSGNGLGFGWCKLPLAIYVPDNSVTAYKSITSGGTNNESVWASPDIQAVIKPMSEMPQLYRNMGTVTQADIDRV